MAAILFNSLAKQLVDQSILEAKIAEEALKEAQKHQVSFVTYLVENRLADPTVIAILASTTFGLPLVDLSAFNVEQFPHTLINEKLIREHNALPIFKRGSRLFICIADPSNLHALDNIKFATGLNLEIVLTSEIHLQKAIDTCLDDGTAELGLAGTEAEDLDEAVELETEENTQSSQEDIKDAPLVRFVNKILLDAIRTGASDIHVEPYENQLRIRYRADGILKEVATPPKSFTNRLLSRLKVMAKMDISERRLPQDGRIKLKLSKFRSVDFRVNSLPTLWGEKICLRILDSDASKLNIDHLGYENDQKALFLDALAQPQGMILVTGPTGSGKTLSLYTGLKILNTPERNISTAEDPVEINLPGINQVNVNPKIGLDFSTALRAFLRQHPDVVMVGEVRDLETAEIAIKAAQTGHLVLSTLHTNSAAETLMRLHSMGIPSFNIATAVSLIIAQRLARRLCNYCKQRLDIPETSLLEFGFSSEEIPNLKIYGPQGCAQCYQGYKGRTGIYEVVKITDAMARIIMENANAIEIADQARKEGFMDLRTAGLKKVKAGITSLAELNRVITG